MNVSFTVRAIGEVVRPDGVAEGGVETNTTASIRISPEWVDQLTGLEAFSHLVVVAWLDRAERRQPDAGLMRPEGREDLPEVGAFAIRTPKRPNPIGLCYPKLISIERDTLTVTGLDFWDGTPILDIKGYYPRDEFRPDASVPEWLTRLWLDHDTARIAQTEPEPILGSIETPRGTVVFRHSTIADAPAALVYINALSAEQTFILMQGEQLTLADETAYFASMERQRASGDAVHLVAEANGEIVGIMESNREPRVFAHIAKLGISIAKDWRGLGLGRKLMEALLAETERSIAGLEMFQLECFGTNKPAIALYQSLGFVECGRIPNRIRHRGEFVDELIMTRPARTTPTQP